MLKYKGQLAGIEVYDTIDEKNTSNTCHACGKVLPSNRKHRGMYSCSSGWKTQAYERSAEHLRKGFQGISHAGE
jgi:transposase